MSGYELAALIVSVVAVIVASLLSWRSNRIASHSKQAAEEANKTAHESNEIARESNEIAERTSTRIERLERDRIEHERAAIVTIRPDELALTIDGLTDDYYPFEIANIGRSRANTVRVRWWMMFAPEPDRLLKRLLSESFSLGDIRRDDKSAAALYLYIPPTSRSVDVRFQLSWDDGAGERYHHSEFVYSFTRPDTSLTRTLQHYLVGAYLDNEIHPTYRGRIERQKTLVNLEKLTGWLSRPHQPNAPDDWTRVHRDPGRVDSHLTRELADNDSS